MNHPHFNSVFTIASIHGMDYEGPNFEQEVKEAKEAIKSLEAQP